MIERGKKAVKNQFKPVVINSRKYENQISFPRRLKKHQSNIQKHHVKSMNNH